MFFDWLSQKIYDRFLDKKDVRTIIEYNGPKITKTEKELLDLIAPKAVLDIGSADGKRIFPYYIKNNINFWGLEKNPRVIASAPKKWRNKILKVDIRDVDFLKLAAKFDLVAFFCFAFSALHLKNDRYRALENSLKYLKKSGYLIIHSYEISRFETRRKGLHKKVHRKVPPQYFPSLNEFNNLANRLGLFIESIVKVEEHELPMVYLVFRKIT